MTTPVLSKKQQKKSLSAKKGPIKGLRNVLAHPQQLYWPIIKSDQCVELEKLFRESISAMKCQVKRMPWSQMKALTKEERSKIRKTEREKRQTMLNKQIVGAVVTGTNAVTRSLEKHNICSVLLDADVDPPLLIKHIVMMAQNKKIPVLQVPFLRTASAECMDFSCIAFALKSIVSNSEDHHFYPLYNKILDYSSNLLPLSNSMQSLPMDEKEEDVKMDALPDDNEASTNKGRGDNSKAIKPFIVSTNVYKYRNSAKERVFVPPSAKSIVNEEDLCDFIGLGASNAEGDINSPVIPKHRRYIDIHSPVKSSEENGNMETDNEIELQKCVSKSNEKKRKMSGVTYMSLKIKRVQGNDNRIKATKGQKMKKIV